MSAPAGARLALAAVLVVGAVFTLGTLDAHGFWLNEVYTAQTTQLSFPGMVVERQAHGHPPIFFAMAWAMAAVFGENEFALRLPAAIAGLAAIFVLGAMLARAGHPWAGALAALLLVANRHHLEISQDARPYTLTLLFLMGSTWVLAFPTGRRRRDGIVFGLFSVLALYSHGSAAFAITAQVIFLLVRRPVAWHLIAGAAVAGLLFLPWAIGFSEATEATHRLSWIKRKRVRFGHQIADPYYWSRTWWSRGPAWIALWCALIAAGLAGALRLGRLGAALAAVWLGAPLLAHLLVLTGYPEVTKVARYFAASTAAQAGLVGGFLAGALERPVGSGSRTAFVRAAAAAAVAIALVVIGAHGALRLAARDNHPAWREAARRIERDRAEDEAVVIDHSFRAGNWKTFNYYYGRPFFGLPDAGRLPRTPEAPKPEPDPRGDPDQLSLPEGTNGVWIYSPKRRKLPEEERRILGGLTERFPHEETVQIRGGKLVHRWRDEG